MSSEFLACRVTGDARELAFDDVEPREPIGRVADVRERVDAVLPGVRWKESDRPPLGHVVFGRCADAELQFSPDADGQVTSVMISRVARPVLDRLLRALDCVALDLQDETVVRPA